MSPRFFVVLVTSAVLCLVVAVPGHASFGNSFGLADHWQINERRPDLKSHSDLERFKGMGTAIGEKSEPGLSRAHAPTPRVDAVDIPVNRPEYSHDGARGADRSKLK